MTASKSRSPSPVRLPVDRCVPRVEPLESRRLRTATPDPGQAGAAVSTALADSLQALTVVQASPADGGMLTRAPASLEVTFNQPFDPFTLGQDIGLDEVDAHGVATPLDPSLLAEPTNLAGPTATLSVALAQALGPGHYQIVLLGSSSLMSADDRAALSNNGVDQTLAVFTIATPGPTLSIATDLGAIGSTTVVRPGSLDLAANPGAYSLSRIELAPGHFWRLGLEVSAQRDGGTLASTLALFDAHGKVIDTAQIGRPDAPQDPYLFDGLEPGTYYVGVSGAGDQPGTPTGYDPVLGVSGASALAQDGGPFRLHLVADPADTPTQLTALTLDHADPDSPAPTGVTLQFSAALRFDPTLRDLSQEGHGQIEIVDAQGTTWPVAAATYSEGAAKLSYVFDGPLPEGAYTVLLPGRGGLVDLAGVAPVASGEPAGVLGSFTVDHAAAPASDPGNFGAIPLATLADGAWMTRAAHLDPGAATTERFAIEYPGFYEVRTAPASSPSTLNAGLTDSTGASLKLGDLDANRAYLRFYQPGVYFVRLGNAGPDALDVTTSIKLSRDDFSSLLDNGIGQGPALNLRLISPPPAPASAPALALAATSAASAPDSAGSPFAGGSVSVTAIAPSAGAVSPASSPAVVAAMTPAPASETASASASTVTAAPGAHASPSTSSAASTTAPGAVLILNVGGVLTGAPNLQAEQITVSAHASPALSALPIGQASRHDDGRATGWWVAEAGAGPPRATDLTALDAVDGALSRPLRPDPIEADLLARASIDSLPGIDVALAAWNPPPQPTGPDVASGPAAERFLMLRDDLLPESKPVQRADLSLPLGLGVVAALGLRLRRPLLTWLYRRHAPASLPSRPMACRCKSGRRVLPRV